MYFAYLSDLVLRSHIVPYARDKNYTYAAGVRLTPAHHASLVGMPRFIRIGRKFQCLADQELCHSRSIHVLDRHVNICCVGCKHELLAANRRDHAQTCEYQRGAGGRRLMVARVALLERQAQVNLWLKHVRAEREISDKLVDK